MSSGLCVNRGRYDSPGVATVNLQDGVVAARAAGVTSQQHSTAHACAAADAKLPGGVPMAGVRQSNV